MNMQEEIRTALHQRAEQVTAALVGLESDSMQGHEGAVADWILQFFETAGIQAEKQECAPGRYNVIAELPGRRSDRTILFSGHIDTVPLGDESLWHFPPLSAQKADGKLYGRGTCDMKGGIACSMCAAEYLAANQIVPSANFRLVYDVDEENTNLGLRTYLKTAAPADFILVGEPTNLRLAVGHRGVMAFTAEFFGKSAHVGQAALGVNAIDGALCAAEKIRRLEQALSQRTQEYLGSPSIFTTQISGGKKVNVIPDYAQIRVDRRLIAGETPESCTAQMQKILDETARETGCRTKLTVTTSCPPGLSRPELPELTAAAALLREQKLNDTPEAFGASCEMGMLQAALGAPAVILGPGSIEQAHQIDEFVTCSQLHEAAELYIRIFTELFDEGGV